MLNGTLYGTLLYGFGPTNGDAFVVLTYGSATGRFAALNLPALGGGLGWRLDYGSTCAVLRVVTAASADSDGDGISDAWETTYFGGATNANPSANTDGDGFNALEEYIADTNPTNSASRFPAITNIGAAVWILEIDPTSTGRIYDVDWSTNLLAPPPPWTAYGFDRWGTGSNLFFVITNNGPVRFYRTGVRLPE